MLNKKYMFGILFLLACLIIINDASAAYNLTFKDPIKYQGANNTALKRISGNYTMTVVLFNGASANATISVRNITIFYNSTGVAAKAIIVGISGNTTNNAARTRVSNATAGNQSALKFTIVTGPLGSNLGTVQPAGTLYWFIAQIGSKAGSTVPTHTFRNTTPVRFVRVDNAAPGMQVQSPPSNGWLWPNSTFSTAILADENITTAFLNVNGKSYTMTRTDGTANARRFTAASSSDLNPGTYTATFTFMDNASTVNIGTGKIDFVVQTQPNAMPSVLDQGNGNQLSNAISHETTMGEVSKTITGAAVGAVAGAVVGSVAGPIGIGLGAVVGAGIGTLIGVIL